MRLIPTDQWVYHLYRVEYFRDEAHTQPLYTKHFRASCEQHLTNDILEYGPTREEFWWQWECIKENVGGPKVVGSLYGMPLHGPTLVDEEELRKMLS